MPQRRKILVLVDWYLPGFKAGGPIRSVANIVQALKDEFEFSIVTRDTDYLETSPYKNVESDKWLQLGDGTRVWYFSSASLNRTGLRRLLESETYDAVYLNSFFSFYFSLLPLYLLKRTLKSKARIILAPRGMLASNALSIKKHKKKIFLTFAKLLGLHDGIAWHASSQLEEQEIRAVFPAANVKVALNIPSSEKVSLQPRIKSGGEIRLFFLSRIAIKKNLHAAIEAVCAVGDRYKVQFDIYGPVDEAHYWEQCKAIIDKAPAHVKIEYKGSLDNNIVHDTLSKYHFMLFPTLNENYGHVILESLSSGCPVIVSDQTPWRDLEAKKAGWDIRLNDHDAFVAVIEKCAAMPQAEFEEWSESAFAYSLRFLHNEATLQQNKELFS